MILKNQRIDSIRVILKNQRIDSIRAILKNQRIMFFFFFLRFPRILINNSGERINIRKIEKGRRISHKKKPIPRYGFFFYDL